MIFKWPNTEHGCKYMESDKKQIMKKIDYSNLCNLNMNVKMYSYRAKKTFLS